jgi:hypothetical protein
MWYAVMYLVPGQDTAVLIAANRASPAVRRALDGAARKLAAQYSRP